MRFAARTHPGARDGQNEDAVGWDEANCLWFVADGMGGHASGDVASSVVKQSLLTAGPMPLGQALERAHAAVLTTAATDSAYNNMGSTAVAIRIGSGQTEVAWVGDSRAYLWNGRTLAGITRDHSFLELLREQESLTETQLRNHPNRNLVTQTLGIGMPEPSVRTVPLCRGDWLLLCSDGLTDELEDAAIADTLRSYGTQDGGTPDAAADALIAATLAHGGKDNVSVVIVEYDGPDGISIEQRNNGVTPRWWLAILAGAFVVLLFLVWWLA